MKNKTEEMISEFQCSGCVNGGDPTTCGSFNLEEQDDAFYCSKHCMGTMRGDLIKIALGLPKGFNREGFLTIRLYLKMPPTPIWNHLNVPVWAMEKDGYLFVKTFLPRINKVFIDVIKGVKIKDINASRDATSGKSRLTKYETINVTDFYDEID